MVWTFAGYADFGGVKLLGDVSGVGDKIVVGVERQDAAPVRRRARTREIAAVMFGEAYGQRNRYERCGLLIASGSLNK